jgi:hypothetical protein
MAAAPNPVQRAARKAERAMRAGMGDVSDADAALPAPELRSDLDRRTEAVDGSGFARPVLDPPVLGLPVLDPPELDPRVLDPPVLGSRVLGSRVLGSRAGVPGDRSEEGAGRVIQPGCQE